MAFSTELTELLGLRHPIVLAPMGGSAWGALAAAVSRAGGLGLLGGGYGQRAWLALAQLPNRYRRGRRTLIRADTAGGIHEFLNWLSTRGRWL
jgi:nitronate monooxygenase